MALFQSEVIIPLQKKRAQAGRELHGCIDAFTLPFIFMFLFCVHVLDTFYPVRGLFFLYRWFWMCFAKKIEQKSYYWQKESHAQCFSGT